MRSRVFTIAALLAASACTRPVPGVLTLAPAGMRTTGACVPHPDGTLSLPVGATADSTVYVDAGDVTITVTAKAASDTYLPVLEVWFAGSILGSMRVPLPTLQPLRFHAHARSSGPTALRITLANPPDVPAPAGPVVDVAMIVITEP
jgi:hypothetical protein